MDKLFGNLKEFFKPKQAIIDSFVFRLHYRITLATLFAFSILVTGRQYLGDPIDCISRDDIPPDLLDTYCWIHTTFSLVGAWHKEVGVEVPYPGISKFTPGENRVYHAYYQWVCFVLFLQALMFYVPRYIWKNFESHRIKNLTMDFGSPIVDACKKTEGTTLLVEYLHRNLGNHKVYGLFYSFCEALNFINVVGQIYLTDLFLGGEFTTYGIDVVKFTEWEWDLRFDPMIKVFPRMTKCTFHKFGSSGDVQKHDAMCLLPINIVNEKIYIFLWFWFVILALLSGVQVLFRIFAFISVKFRRVVLQYRCPRMDRNQFRLVVKECDSYDWLILTFLCENMDGCNFKHVMIELAKKIEDEKKKKPQTNVGTNAGTNV